MPLEKGTRVLLRRPRKGDEAEFLDLVRESAAFLRPWEPRPPPGRAVDSPERFFEILRQNRKGLGPKTLVCRIEERRIVGMMNFNNLVRGVFQSTALGYWIGAPHARQGLMSEALQLALRHAFRTLEMHRVEANLMEHNLASRALVKRAGFRLEGYSPRFLKIAGRWQDHERWALLREEWQPRKTGTRR